MDLNFELPYGHTALIIDEPNIDLQYVGYNKRGSETTKTNWTVQRISTTGSITTISYGRGTWDDRAILEYK